MADTCGPHMGSKGSDNELAYASPVVPYWDTAIAHYGHLDKIIPSERRRLDEGLPAAHWYENGELGTDGRKRRYRNCVDDKANLVDGFINEFRRVGGPYLCSIPIKTFPEYRPSSFSSRTWSKSRIMTRVREILDSYKITTTREPALVGRRSVFNPEPEPILTFLVYSRDANHNAMKAAKEIYALLESEHVRSFSVEVCHPRCEDPRLTFPILETDSISKCWEDVQHAIVDSVDLADVMIVGCYRRGRGPNPSVEETLPTVLIVVESTSNHRNWKKTREEIVDILSKFNLSNVAVEIVKDELESDPSSTGSLNPVLLSGTAKIGESVAPSSDEYASWTLGGFVELQSPVGHGWHVFGLTCFHCVVPDPDTVRGAPDSFVNKMRVWCRDGIKLYENETQHLFVDHPSVSALKNERKRLEKEIHRGISNVKEGESHKEVHWKDRDPNPDLSLPFRNKALEAEKLLHDIKMFINEDSQYLGHVIAGSGFGEHMERATGSEDRKERWDINVDWALVDIADGRRPTNALGSGFAQQIPQGRNLDLSSRHLYMQGHGSGRRTEGSYSSLSDYLVNPRVVAGKQLSLGTTAYSIVGTGGHFSAAGDTGAFVLTKEKYVVGMVHCRTHFNNITYFMHIKDIFAHILETTGMDGIRIYNG